LADALHAQEQEPWYLISGTELSSIEELLEKSEKDRQSWELQARGLRIRAEKSESDSILLNRQLAVERRQFRALEDSFNEYERDQSVKLSLKNGEIEELKKEVAKEKLEKAEWKSKATIRLIIIIAAAVAVGLFFAIKIFLWIKGGAAASLMKSFVGKK
jgi:anti-sigma-K factor RskA